MAADRLTIDTATIFDNIDERRVEFAGDISNETRAFAVQYDLLEALSAELPDDRAVTVFEEFEDRIAELGAVALARDSDAQIVVISENDLD